MKYLYSPHIFLYLRVLQNFDKLFERRDALVTGMGLPCVSTDLYKAGVLTGRLDIATMNAQFAAKSADASISNTPDAVTGSSMENSWLMKQVVNVINGLRLM